MWTLHHCFLLDLELCASVVSAKDRGLDGSRQMLLQSLARPDLGLTVLLLDSNGQITGGDESWTPGTTPIIRGLTRRSNFFQVCMQPTRDFFCVGGVQQVCWQNDFDCSKGTTQFFI